MLSWQSLIFINKSTMISIFLLFGAQVFFYPQSLKCILARLEMRERAWPFSCGEEKAYWERTAIDLEQKAKTRRPSHCPQHIPIRPCLSPGKLKILTWSCNAPCGQTLVQIKAGELCLLSCRNAILSVFSLIIASPLLRTIQIFLIVQFLGIETHIGKKSYTYKGFTWLLWNQNRKSCILHKPANYFILITVIFTP